MQVNRELIAYRSVAYDANASAGERAIGGTDEYLDGEHATILRALDDTLDGAASAPPSRGWELPPQGSRGRRNRIVILGRRQAGKTVYLSVLYHTLWKQGGPLSLVALDGGTHTACLDTISTIRGGEWPASTVGSKYLNLEVRWRNESWPMVSLDYPGEVFRKAFIDNTQTEDVRELLEHVDRAAAVIALVDPAVVSGDSLQEAAEDDFGMLKAIERIRQSPGGEVVPIAFVLTKYDVRKRLIRESGGTVAFVKRWYRHILKSAGRLDVFVAAAVPEPPRGKGLTFDPNAEPRGVVKPLQFIIEQLHDSRAAQQVESAGRARREAKSKELRTAELERLRSVKFWAVFWLGFVLLAGLLWLGTILGLRYL